MKELFEAVRANDMARVKELVAADGSLAIFAAAITGNVEQLTQMLEGNRALVGLMSTDGWTPLHLAAFFGQLEAAKVLLDNGALVDARSTNAMENMPLHAATAGRHTEMVRLLIDHGAPVNARQHGGWSPLHAAAQNGDIEMANLLISAGADVLARAGNNQTPLDLALTKGQQAMVDYLESNGAKL